MRRRVDVFACLATAVGIVLSLPLGAYSLTLPNDAEAQSGTGLLKEALPKGALSDSSLDRSPASDDSTRKMLVEAEPAADLPMSGAVEQEGSTRPSPYCADNPDLGSTLSGGDLVIDLSVGTAQKLSISAQDVESCRNHLTSVEFTYSRPAVGYTDLVIEADAGRGGAFSQISEGDNELVRLTFPEGLKSLTVGEGAFAQQSTSGANALNSVTFPQSLNSLEVGRGAFSQRAGTRNALSAVSFPESLERLVLADEAFVVDGDRHQLFLYFPTDSSPAMSVELGREITRAGTPWVWLGADGLTTKSASWQQRGREEYPLFAAGRATFVPNGGSLLPGTLASMVVFPEVEGQSQASEHVEDLNPVGFKSSRRNYSLALPLAERPGARLAGWCPTEWIGSECPDQTGTFREVSEQLTTVSLPGGELHQTFFAGWVIDNVPGPTVSENACGAPLMVAVPPPVQGLYVYVVSSAAETITTTAIPSHPSVLLRGQTVWESGTFAAPCTDREFVPGFAATTTPQVADAADDSRLNSEGEKPSSSDPSWLVGIASILIVSLTALGGMLFGVGKSGSV